MFTILSVDRMIDIFVTARSDEHAFGQALNYRASGVKLTPEAWAELFRAFPPAEYKREELPDLRRR